MITIKLADFTYKGIKAWVLMNAQYQVWTVTVPGGKPLPLMGGNKRSLFFALTAALECEEEWNIPFHWTVNARRARLKAVVHSTGREHLEYLRYFYLTALVQNQSKRNCRHADKVKEAALLVKYLGTERKLSYPAGETELTSIAVHTVNLLTELTPREAAQLFPLAKTYDGEKYQCKDYFYCRDYFHTLDMNKPFDTEDKVLEFCWEWMNWDLQNFLLCQIHCMDAQRKVAGQPSMAETFAHTIGLPLYHMVKNEFGEEILVDEGGNERQL